MQEPETAAPAAEEQPSAEAEQTHAIETAQDSAPQPEEPSPPPGPGEFDLAAVDIGNDALKAVIEAITYVTEEPVAPAQIALATGQPEERIKRLLDELAAEYARTEHGIVIREVAGGYKMATKPEHHEAIRAFAKSLRPALKLSLAALETLATIAYKQPITAPEIMAIRGVQGAGVLKTLLDRKLIATAGRKSVIGRPMLYKTTKDFLVQFGLKDLTELPTLKEFEELRRLATEGEVETSEASAPTGDQAEAPSAEAAPDAPAAQPDARETQGAEPAEPVPPEDTGPENA